MAGARPGAVPAGGAELRVCVRETPRVSLLLLLLHCKKDADWDFECLEEFDL